MRVLAAVLTAVALLFAAIPTLAQPAPLPPPQFTATFLGLPAGAAAIEAKALNNRRQVAGTVTLQGADARQTPFVWSEDTGFTLFMRDVAARGVDINDAGVVLGSIVVDGVTHAFTWIDGQGVAILGAIDPWSINSRGEVAGTCGATYACVIRGGEVQPLAGLARGEVAVGRAYGINDRGFVSGYIQDVRDDGSRYRRPALWDPANRLILLPLPGQAPDGTAEGVALDVNDRGQATGYLTTPSNGSALIIWNGGHTVDRFGIGGYDRTGGLAINRAGTVLGNAMFGGNGPSSMWGFALRGDGTSAWFDTQVLALNDVGQVLGLTVNGPIVWTLPSLFPPRLHIDTPNTASTWGIGTRQRLAWTYAGSASAFEIQIDRDGDDVWEFVATVPNKPGPSQNFYWTVEGAAAAQARLLVRAVGDPEAADMNDAGIRIGAAHIAPILPNRSTTTQIGATQTIFFSHNLGADAAVAIDVSGDDGRTWRAIAARTLTRGADTSSFRWPVDLLPTARARVRIRALDGSRATAVSEAFVVTGGVAGTSAGQFPAGGVE